MKQYIQKINDFKIPLSFKKLRIVFILIVLGIFASGIFESFKDGEIVWKIARNESGGLSWGLLVFIIFISLLSKIFTKTKILKQLLPLRKEAGIMVFFIIFAHAIFHFLRADVFGDFDKMYFQSVERSWVILLGTIAFMLMIPLFLTSCTYAVKKMGYKSWKLLQRLTHVIFILAALHVGFIRYPKYDEIEFVPLIILVAYLLGYSWLFLSKKKVSK